MKKKLFGIIGLFLVGTILLTSCHKHVYIYHEEKGATCEADGYEAYYSCEDCDLILDKDKNEIESIKATKATGHTYVEHERVEATCDTNGMDKFYTCANCNLIFDSNKVVTSTLPLIPALGHKYVEHGKVEATCEADGYEVYYSCEACDKLFDSEKKAITEAKVIPALGHKYHEHEEVLATCEADGNSKYYTCDTCDLIFDKDKTKIDAIPVLTKAGHKYTSHDKVDSTYYETGCEAYYSCDVCNKIFNSDKVESTLDSLVIPVKTITTKVIDTRNGIVTLEINDDEFLECLALGDIVKVVINNKEYIAPVVNATYAVEFKELCLVVDETVTLEIYDDDIVSLDSILVDMATTITIEEKLGYIEILRYKNLTISKDRDDYSELSDADYANFRDVTTANMGDHILFRSSSLIDSSINRNTIADDLAFDNYCNVIIDLDNADDTEAKEHDGYRFSHFGSQKHMYAQIDDDYSVDFDANLKEILLFIATYRGVYLISGSDGNESVGIIVALIEDFMGASKDEMISDYMQSYINLYGIEADEYAYTVYENYFNEVYSYILDGLTVYEYFTSLGLTQEELDSIKTNLSSDRDPIRINNYVYFNEPVFVTNIKVKFTELTDDDFEEFYNFCDTVVEAVQNEEYTFDELNSACEEIDDAYYSFISLYFDTKILADLFIDLDCYNQIDKINECFSYIEYADGRIRLLATSNKYKDYFYSGYTEEQLAEVIEELENNTDPELVELNAELNSLVAKYRSSTVTFDEFIKEYIPIANEYGIKKGYNDYLDYVYEENYSRCFDPDDILSIIDYAREYIMPLYYDSLKTIKELGKNEDVVAEYKDLNDNFVHNKYILDDYFEWLGGDIYEHYKTVWTTGDINISNLINDYETAYNNDYKRRLFFGGECQDLGAFVHEFGHANAGYYNVLFMIDINEIQSQGNELLLCYYLENNPHGYSAEAIEYYIADNMYLLYNNFINALLSAVLEVKLYSLSEEELESANIQAMWNDLAKELDVSYNEYGYSNCIRFNSDYYKYPLAYSIGYYISYAVSILNTLELYAAAEENIDDGLAMYERIYSFGSSDDLDTSDYFAILEYCGLHSPFDEYAYKLIYELNCDQEELSVSYDRDDYPELSDYEFANLRDASTTNMGLYRLYRSSSLINDCVGRNLYADYEAYENYCNYIIDLDNATEELAKENGGYMYSHFMTQDHFTLDLADDYTSDLFKTQLKAILQYIATYRGIYLISGSDGIDDVGIVMALIEAYMGASDAEIIADYMKSYANYYGKHQSNIVFKEARDSFINTYYSVLNGLTITEYFVSLGLTNEELVAITLHLSEDYDEVRINNYKYYTHKPFVTSEYIEVVHFDEEDYNTTVAFLDGFIENVREEQYSNSELSKNYNIVRSVINGANVYCEKLDLLAKLYAEPDFYDEYNYCYSVKNKAYSTYYEFYIECASNKYKNVVYKNKTQEQIDESVARYQSYLNKEEANTLLSEMTILQNKYSFGEITAIEMLKSYIPKANEYASGIDSSYDNYLDYMYANDYGRDYDSSVLADNHEGDNIYDYVKEYIIPLYYAVKKKIDNRYLDAEETIQFDRLEGEFVHNLDLLNDYYEWLGNDINDNYKNLWSDGTYYISNIDNPNLTAYSQGDLLLFSGKYQYTYVLVHEFGHMNAHLCDSNSGHDIREIQSQGDEMLFYYYLQCLAENGDCLNYGYSANVVNAYFDSQLEYMLKTIIRSALVSKMERIIWNMTSDELATANLQQIWNDLCAEIDEVYNTSDYDEENPIFYNSAYYEIAICNSPGYYMSYLTSAVNALEIYCMQVNGEESEGLTAYTKLYSFASEENPPTTRTDILAYCGLTNPFIESVYQTINNTLITLYTS